jgi:hypothetical protein
MTNEYNVKRDVKPLNWHALPQSKCEMIHKAKVKNLSKQLYFPPLDVDQQSKSLLHQIKI